MTKRILSFMVVLAMVLSLVPVFAVAADVSDPTATKHTHTDAHACSEQCDGNVTWVAWTAGDKLPTENGHYYLTQDVQLAATTDVAAGKDITICLNGYNIRSKTNARIGFVYGKLTISDCTAYTDEAGSYICGSVVGSTAADGAVYGVRRGGTLVLESGRITGGKTTGTAGGGALFLQKGTTAGRGGYMYMYGGEVSGNEGYHGGGVCLGGADSGCIYSAFFMYGGTIIGNTARGNGGGIHAENRSVVEFHGGTVEGNTAAGKGQAVNIAGQWTKVSATGTVVLDGMNFAADTNAGLKVNGLAQGTEITMTTAATDIAKIVSLSDGGKQDSWNTHWVTANGESVSLRNGAFVLGHYHGDVKYEAWTGGDSHNTLPTGAKNYYLANDILRNTNGGTVTIAKGSTQHMCLNGHTITHRNPAGRLYNIQGNFFLEDCSAYTDGEGNYISGGITYGGATASTRTYGNCFSVQVGSTMTMEAGQIYGFYSNCKDYEDSVPVYIQGSSANGKAVFTMNGGQIHSNSSKSKGAAIKESVNATSFDPNNPTQINICGGKIWGNTSTTGGAVAATGDVIHITGGVITDNTTVNGAVQALDKSRILIAGNPQIIGNKGGNLYLAGDILIELGDLTGGKIGISAAKVGRIVSTEGISDPTAFFESDDSEVTVKNKNNCLYLGAAHEHGVDGGAGEMGFTKWTSTDSLPTEGGNYYLVNDIQLKDAQPTLAADVVICLNGKTVTAKSGKRIMAIGNGAELTITDCQDTCGTITGGTHNYGAAFNVNRGGSLKLYKGKLTGHTSGQEGGAVYIQAANADTAGGKFQMYGGEISGNKAIRGGAVCLAGSDMETSQAAFAFYGGVIRDNTATSGGAVYMYKNAVVALAGGEITGNSATAAGGGVYVHAQAERLQLVGSPVVKDNKSGAVNDNIHLVGDATMTVAELTQDAQIFLTAEKCERAVTNEVTEAEAGCFHSDSAYRMLVYRDSKVYFEISDEHTHCNCYYKTEGCDHTEVKWQAWESTTSLPTSSGHYYLLTDVQLADRCTMPKDQDIYLCLNGKTVTAKEGDRLITVQGSLSLTDCVGSGKLTGGNRTFGGAININRMATFNLFGGEISGNKSETVEGQGGAIYLQAGSATEKGGTVNVYGGKITGNEAYQGGGIYASAPGGSTETLPATVNIYGGEISNNRAGYEAQDAEGNTVIKGGAGAAVYAGKYSAFTMTGGTVTENYGMAYGGTIYLNGTAAKFSGGRIHKNESLRDGGGLYAVNGSQVEITGDMVISNNNTPKGAGGGFGAASKSKITMTGGTVSGNWALQGGGVIIQSGASMEMSGGTINGNYSKYYAGGIYVNVPASDGTASYLKMTGGTIRSNTSDNAGGGIYGKQAKVDITGGTISYNTTKNYGCGVYLHTSTGNITGGSIIGNVSGKDGAGIYAYAGRITLGGSMYVSGNQSQKGAGGGVGFTKECQATMYGGTITGNKAPNAGGVIVQGKAHFVMTGGSVVNNTATSSGGGGVYVNSSSAEIRGSAKIRGNAATRYGGGIYSNTSTVTVTGVTVSGNFAKSGSGGMHALKGKVTVKDAVFAENTTDVAGGGLCATKECQLLIENSVFEKNTANNGGGVLIQNWAKAMLNDVIIRENESAEGSGLYVFSNVEVTMNGGQVCDNVSFTKLDKNGNTVGGIGAGVHVTTSTRTQSGQSKLYLNNVTIEGNKAARAGGGVYVNMQMLCYMDGCTVQNNESGSHGAGIYQASGTGLTVKNSKILANTGAATGSAIYAGSDFTLIDSTITGNKTTEGAAVYIAPARYDGHSYTNATVKFGGDLQIEGNEGTQSDLYMDEGTAAGVTAEGFGKNTKIYVQLHSGVLTNAILGQYNYEGGDQLYTITYGDRSLTDPEYVAPAEDGTEQPTQTKTADGGNTLLYVGVGIIALAVIAVIILLITKKKKTVESK